MREKLTLFLSLLSVCMTLVIGIYIYLKDNSSPQKISIQPVVASPSNVEFDENLKSAIVIGINDYKEQSGVQPLQYSVVDAEETARAFENLGFETALLRDAQKKIVLETLSQVSKKIKDRGTLVFFFSGHGLGNKANNENYLMLNDSYARYQDELEQTALSMTEIYAILRAEGVKRAVLFIDACRDDATYLTSKSSSDLSFLYKESSGYHTVYAAEWGEFSYELKELGHGAFTYTLNRALRGGVEPAADGRLMLRPVIEFIETDIRRVFEQAHLRGKTQKPRYSVTEGSGDILLGRITDEKMITPRSLSDHSSNDFFPSSASEIEVEHRKMIEHIYEIKSLRND